MDIKKILQELTIEEKCSLLVGKDGWHTVPFEKLGIPSIMVADGPHGLRKEQNNPETGKMEIVKAVCFPPATTVACSFDPEISKRMGSAIGKECRKENVHVLLGPGVNIKRNPLCGRNFEYYSEDPVVSGKIASGFIQGLNKEKVGACVKHYAFNSQESYRMVSSSILDERAKNEIYYRSFTEAIKAKPAMVMCSYNRVDDIYASENKELLDDTLRNKFGFDKVIVSDWGAVKNRVNALKATLDLEMPVFKPSVGMLIEAYENQIITEAEIDKSVERLLKLIDEKKDNLPLEVDFEKNHLESKKIAEESMVLLKNEESILPLKTSDNILIVGALAKNVRYQGGGSSHINSYKVDNITDCMPNEVVWEYAEGYAITGDGQNDSLAKEAIEKAKGKDKIVFVLGLPDNYETEGMDRINLNIPKGQKLLLEKMATVNENIVVVLLTGSPVRMPWLSKCKGLLLAGLGGEAVGMAVADILYGKTSPSGRLAETYALELESIPSQRRFAKGNGQVYYQESIYVGYRYFETADRPVLFPFGYGKSYTEFQYENLHLSSDKLAIGEKLSVEVTVRNTGKVKGKEVVQLYVGNPPSKIFRAVRELKDFAKIELKPGEEKIVSFTLDQDAFSYYNTDIHDFVPLSGTYSIEIRKNAHEGILSSEVLFSTKNDIPVPEAYAKAKSYFAENGLTMTDDDFSLLTGNPLEKERIRRRRPYNLDDSINDLAHTLIGKIIRRKIIKEALKTLDNPTINEMAGIENTICENSLRIISVFSGDKITLNTAKAILALCNNNFRKAARLFKGSAGK
ncbi:MAG TPA: glycoside hydrolase family 3 C-terminal domain-containing protein [Bacillota bacterium]|nr:glycoside hydrolase family 3 C-terminal domain-containing protein [Bacillota bacterium]HPF42671.1 glycoside hydrolase family 3 C-terminal domain-containing protein [Bacillota bacterium]HPJ85423.1 glycoside hydrolase family 3 C-terminal domain-containing protein [Bacillota bacterium]HRX91780.1 glycoside hydrolase family 3 C-terminal domain-containing protein [Candidatus Izemoplasmatales bacterium]